MTDDALVALVRAQLPQPITPFQLREICRLARSFIEDGVKLTEAVDYACGLIVRGEPKPSPWAAP